MAREPIKRQLFKTFFGMKPLQYEVYQFVHRGGIAVDVVEVDISDSTIKIYQGCR